MKCEARHATVQRKKSPQTKHRSVHIPPSPAYTVYNDKASQSTDRQWRLVVEFAGGASSHFLIFLHSLWAVYLPLFSYKSANFSKLCSVLVE